MASRKNVADPTAAVKKTTPAANLIKTTEEEQEAAPQRKRKWGERIPEGQHKDTRVTFLLREHEIADLKIYARLKGTTANAIVNDLISQLVTDNADLIAKYKELVQQAQDS